MTTAAEIRQLLEAGVHFGHQTKRWNPKMREFIFGERNGIYIIDLEKAFNCLTEAREFLRDLASQGESILFVGTKKQAQEVVKGEAARCEMFYVTERWLGGTLTNFQTIRKSVKRLRELEKMQADGIFDSLSKKERASLTKEMNKLKKSLGGIADMNKLPGAVFVIDSKKEEIAVREANKLEIPVVALVDTNCDPDVIDFVIPGNDDAIRAIKLITTMVADSVLEGRQMFMAGKAEEEAPAAVEKGARAEELIPAPSEEEIEAAEKKALKGKEKEVPPVETKRKKRPGA